MAKTSRAHGEEDNIIAVLSHEWSALGYPRPRTSKEPGEDGCLELVPSRRTSCQGNAPSNVDSVWKRCHDSSFVKETQNTKLLKPRSRPSPESDFRDAYYMTMSYAEISREHLDMESVLSWSSLVVLALTFPSDSQPVYEMPTEM